MTIDYHEPNDDETFTETAVVVEAINLIKNQISSEDIKVTVSGEYERKGYTTRSAVYPLNHYQNDGDDVVVTVEFTINGWDRRQSALVQAATNALKNREAEENKAKELARISKIAQLEAELAELRK